MVYKVAGDLHRFLEFEPVLGVIVMNIGQETGTTIPFERFFRWLREHASCIIEAGMPRMALYDFDDFHWVFNQDDEGRFMAQMMRGKNIVGEIIIEPSDSLFVQATVDPEAAERGLWVFEVKAGTRDDSFVAAYFVLNHGFEDLGKHEVFRH